MTAQELQIKSMLDAIQIGFESQVSVQVDKSVIVVDFRIADHYLVECCYSNQTAPGAMGLLRRSAAYIDWKARQIHRHYGNAYLMGAVLEAPNVQRPVLERSLTSIMENVDFLFFDVDGLGEYLVGLHRLGCSPGDSRTAIPRLDLWTDSPTGTDQASRPPKQQRKGGRF
jgi:hypothetical protein